MQGCIERGVPFPDYQRILAELAAGGVDATPRPENMLVLPVDGSSSGTRWQESAQKPKQQLTVKVTA